LQTFLVGGAVRDKLLGYPYHEKDWVVVGATPEEMKAKGFVPVGKDFPVFLHPDTKEEHALARTERKTGPGYTGFDFYAAPEITLEQDLERRDLTINAIAETADGEIVDPYGGVQDIKDKKLRHVSSAFCEDPVRILRVARFAARYHHLGFRVADETMEVMRSMVKSGEVDHLVAERTWKELSRALLEKNPSIFIQVLRECGALARIMPEVNRLFGVPQRKDYHPEVDSGVHTLLALEQACKLSDDLTVRFATLVHDLGKGTTPKKILPKHIGHEQRGVPLIKGLCQRLAVPKDCRELAVGVSEYHLHCHKALELRGKTLVKLFSALDAWRRPERFYNFLLCCEADARGRTGLEDRDYPQPEFLREAFAACQQVQARELVEEGFKGAELGEALRRRRVAAVEDFRRRYFRENRAAL
jgi:tRNA nucleotidyltransferase (CCA-adding enzyme)